jgi:hypothetical protein
MTKDNVKAVLASYGRTALIAALSVYVALEGEVLNKEGLEAMLFAAIAAVAGPTVRALNPKDPAFGRLIAPEQSEEH